MKNYHLAIICGVVAAVLIFWSIGVTSGLFGTSMFSSFWWISNEDAYSTAFIMLAIGSAPLLLGINYWLTHQDEQTKIPKSKAPKTKSE